MERAQHSEVNDRADKMLAAPHLCSLCSKRYAVVAASSEAVSLRCTCGGDLVPSPLSPGLYELGGAKKAAKRRKKAPAQPAATFDREADQGYNESHGYGPSHGGPTSPGDAPAPEPAIEAAVPVKEEDPDADDEPPKPTSPDGPGSSPAAERV